jgi:hypothetical protein
MAVKYQCPKCDRRYIEWGAQKLGFKCSNCPDEDLLRVGTAIDMPLSTASLKRRPKKIDTRTALYDDDVDASTFGDGFEEDIDEEITDTDVEPEIAVGKGAGLAEPDIAGDVELDADLEDADDVVDDEIPGALDFDGAVGGEPLDEEMEEEI